MKRSLMSIAASVVACGMCLCAHGIPSTAQTVVKESSVTETKTAAEKGDVVAQFRYAEMLRDGRGVEKNVITAAKWTRKAADAGLAAAQPCAALSQSPPPGLARALCWPPRHRASPSRRRPGTLRRKGKT